MSTFNPCFEQKYENIIVFFLSEKFQFMDVKFSIYLNRLVFVMFGVSRRLRNYVLHQR